MLKSRYQNVLNGHMFAGPVGVHPPPPRTADPVGGL